MDNYISASEAFGKLYELKSSNQPITQDSIEEIISQLSIADKNATTILYTTGGEYNGDPSTKRYIGNTEAYDFIENQQFQSIIRDEIQAANNVTDPNVLDKMMQDYINGVEVYENFKPTGKMSNGTTGPWADVSRRFAADLCENGKLNVFDLCMMKHMLISNVDIKPVLTRTELRDIILSKEEFTWSDFEKYQSEDIGSGIYVLKYKVDFDGKDIEVYLYITGSDLEKKPEKIYMDVKRNDEEEKLDIYEFRQQLIDFIDSFNSEGLQNH